jgi:adenosylmethionine-8-amino-7-oxononanoate aminotransferase
VASIPSPADARLADCLEALDKAHAAQPLAALILEPLVQGAGGMKMYDTEALEGLMAWCKENGVLIIFDEVMTGFYRTGRLFASLWLDAQPDIICLSKGLTGGFLPLSVTTCTAEVYAAFLSNEKSKMLFHGHSFTANPIGCAAANASLDLFEMPEVQANISKICELQSAALPRFAKLHKISNVRSQGSILAMDLSGSEGYLAESGHQIAVKMLEKGIFLRPLGNVIYLMPPYCSTEDEMQWLHQSLAECIQSI